MQEHLVVALLRHADYHQPAAVPSAMLPYGLTPKGITQAEAAGRELLAYSRESGAPFISQVDCSRMRRAWQTAAIIAGMLDAKGALRVMEFEALAERSVGAAANLTTAEIETIVRDDPRFSAPPTDWKSNPDYCLPLQGAESLRQAGARVAAHITSVFTTADRSNERGIKIIVGHGASIRYAAVQLGLLSLDQVSHLSMHYARPIYIVRGKDGFRQVGGEWKIRTTQASTPND